MEEPLFHIHLNVDYPFHLTGILYFPKIKPHMDIHREKIQLYCNQVFVTDEVENIVPEYLTLLHGVIDSPDIPLNVSRSYLQSDQNVKKISNHITKKVADSLADIFKNDRTQFEQKWEDIRLFIQYGMLSDEKFYDRAKSFALLKNTEGKYFTYEEYRDAIKDNQTDKEGQLIYLYATSVDEQYAYIQRAKAKGYDVLLMDSQLDMHIVSQQEQKQEKSRFVRIDSDTIENLIKKENVEAVTLSEGERTALTDSFSAVTPTGEKANYYVTLENVSADTLPVFLTQNEWMRRMKDMQEVGGGGMMGFYGQMPDSYNLVVNTAHPVIKDLLQQAVEANREKVEPLDAQIAEKQAAEDKIRNEQKDKKYDELTQEEKDALSNATKEVNDLKDQRKAVYGEWAKENPRFSQLVDIALLASGLLKGEALSKFVNRSVELL